MNPRNADELLAAIQSGMSGADVAREAGITREYVRRLYDKHCRIKTGQSLGDKLAIRRRLAWEKSIPADSRASVLKEISPIPIVPYRKKRSSTSRSHVLINGWDCFVKMRQTPCVIKGRAYWNFTVYSNRGDFTVFVCGEECIYILPASELSKHKGLFFRACDDDEKPVLYGSGRRPWNYWSYRNAWHLLEVPKGEL